MTNSYIGFLRDTFFLWQIGPTKYVTTCECPPFVVCGCKSIKVKLGILPDLLQNYKKTSFEFYAFGLWLSYSRLKLWQNNKVIMNRFRWGFKRTPFLSLGLCR